jgi:hypothetical protein
VRPEALLEGQGQGVPDPPLPALEEEATEDLSECPPSVASQRPSRQKI